MRKTILLTGATDGIGLELSKKLAKEGHFLLLHGRNTEKLSNLKNTLLKENKELDVELLQADLSNLEDCKEMVNQVLAIGKNIDVIINNAGIYVTNTPKNKDGYDVRFMVNAVAPYCLTQGLLPRLGKGSRVVNVSSAAQSPVDFEKFLNKGDFSHDEAYAQSKLALILWGMELAEKEKAIMTVSVNPKSFLGSKMVKEAYGREGYDLKFGVDILYKASFSEEFATASGKYYDNDNRCFASPHPFAQDKEMRKKWLEILATYQF
ncbi:MAG: SDR family NAD(P)-dependent oxidoreductase [Eubacteriales bacterium]